MKFEGTEFGDGMARIDSQFIRDEIAKFLKEHDLDLAELSRILGFSASATSYLSKKARMVLDGDLDLTLGQLARVAHWMHKPLTQLIRVTQPVASSSGAFATTIVQTGADSNVNASHLSGLGDALSVLCSLSPEQIQALKMISPDSRSNAA